ncbi:MFS transporter, UMF1 family [Marinilactibacillus piezotolerans]|uniref:MFS transporter, UMF1 family n=1 Tax=Marinilactibacillus piezotolerans TaxID=258723 RepID=A0A1I3Y5T2_9LACT|nr:MFS transporter [Marinilactibacillus piezotolerans]SFK27122.1 MFS transporter, UMF1 family [Marinilactibacillus piezotolerans]
MKMKYTKAEHSWMFYDWAGSAFSIIVTTAVFPIYYSSAAELSGVSDANSTAYLGYTISIFTFIVALLSPLLGTMADIQGFKKRFFLTFFSLGVLGTLSLALVPHTSWIFLLIGYAIASIGTSGANVFYDGFLVDVTEPDRMNRVSSRGFSLGYIGSSIPFIISIGFILLAQNEVIPISTVNATRLAFVLTALWWGLFSLPMIRNVEQIHGVPRRPRLIKSSFKRLFSTFQQLKHYRAAFTFLIAYMFYIDGVGTIISMSTAYGKDLGLASTDLLVVLFAVQIVAAPFAILYGRLADRFPGKTMIYVAIIVYIGVCTYAFFMNTLTDFWILAMLIATSQGGIQALSRAYFGRIIPKHKASEFFGLYDIFGRFASIIGPALVAVITQATGQSNYGVFSLIILFLVGFFVLTQVPESETNSDAIQESI